MRVGFYQFTPVFGDTNANVDKLKEALSIERPDILVLPELPFSGYNFINRDEARSLAEEIPGPLTEKLLEISRETGTAISTGFLEKEGDKVYNSSVFIAPEGILARYRKIHLFYEEKTIFTAGDNFSVFEFRGYRFGMLICFDWIFPEAMRTLMLLGAQVILHHANLVLPYCQDAMITRSIENRVFIITANRTGKEDRGGKIYNFTGKSQIVAPGGEVLIKAGEKVEGVFAVDINPEEADNKQINKHNDLVKDRRSEAYRC